MSDATLGPAATPAPITSRALLREARNLVETVWHRQPAIWPIAVVIVIANAVAKEMGTFGTPPYLFYEGVSILVGAALSAICIRAILDYGRGLFALDSNFRRFLGITFVLAIPGFAGAILLQEKVGIAVLVPMIIGLLAFAVLSVRVIPWPIGALVGNRTMTARESWRLTRGGMLIIIGAFLQVALLFVAAGVVLVMLTFVVTSFIHSDIKYFVQIWRPVVAGVAFPVFISLDVAIYKLTIERADLPSHSAV